MGEEAVVKNQNPRFVAFASGSGSNFEAILDAIDQGNLHAICVALIASRPNIGVIEKATIRGIPVHVVQKTQHATSASFDDELTKVVQSYSPDFGVLAGYLQKIPSSVLSVIHGPIFNIHPSLLPKYGGKGFFGMRVHEAVIDAGESESGCTVHLVTDKYDEGPILAQARLTIPKGCRPSELASAVLSLEHTLYPITIQTTLEDYGTLQRTFATAN